MGGGSRGLPGRGVAPQERQELREDLVGDARAHEGVLMAVAVEDQQLVAVARRQLLQAVEAEDVGVGEDAVVTPGHEQHRRSEEHTSELQSLMRISYAVFCLKKKKTKHKKQRKQRG